MKAAAPDWKALSGVLWIRSGGSCEKCGRGLVDADRAERHHRRLRSRGGLHTIPNLLLLCGRCHQEAHAHPTLAKHLGTIVAGWAEPEKVPMFHALHGLVWLTTDGGTTTLPPDGDV